VGVVLLAAALTAAGCGSGGHYLNGARPADPVNLTVYIDDRRVSVSPRTVGAGLVMFIITNQAHTSEGLTIAPAADTRAVLATTGPINPQGTAVVSVNFGASGHYLVTAAGSGGGEGGPARIAPAWLQIGRERVSPGNALSQP
jgi:hypothetical protein